MTLLARMTGQHCLMIIIIINIINIIYLILLFTGICTNISVWFFYHFLLCMDTVIHHYIHRNEIINKYILQLCEFTLTKSLGVRRMPCHHLKFPILL